MPSTAAPQVEGTAATIPHAPIWHPPISEATVRPAGSRWLSRGGPDRPRISVVGTLSLSVLISAGLFAAQLIVKPRHKKGADASVAVDSSSAMNLAAHAPEDADDHSGPVSVPSRFRHVHAPAAHAKAHSTHIVALDEQPAPEDKAEESSETPDSGAAKTHHSAASSRSVRHAAQASDTPKSGDSEDFSTLADEASPPPAAAGNQPSTKHEDAPRPVPVPEQAPISQTAAAPSSLPVLPPNQPSGSSQPALQAAAQQAAPTPSQALEYSSSKWPLVPTAASTAPAQAAAQVSAEAATANAPALTIVPGRPDSVSATINATESRMPTPAPQPAVEPVAARSAQPANVAGLFQDRPAAVAPVQPVANPFETLDRTKVMSFQFRNAPWPLVFAAFAEATGLELRMQAMPRGTFNRWDSARYTPSQTLAILNSELARMGCQAKVFGTALYVVPSGSGDAAIPATTASPVITPAAASNLQMPQYPGVPASATANPAVR